MDLRKVTGVMLLTFMLLSYLSFRAEWNFFMFVKMIHFFRYIDLPLIQECTLLYFKEIYYE